MKRIEKAEKLTDTRFLNLYALDIRYRNGETSKYFVSSRTKKCETLKAITGGNPPDGVIICGLYGEKKDKIVLVRQYRYPAGDYVYELPAGLVEPGEEVTKAGIREMFEETGLEFTPLPSDGFSHPYFTSVGMTDESCSTLFGYCIGTPTNTNQEVSEDIQVVLADRDECRRILREEKVAIMCAYFLMHFISSDDPFAFLTNEA